jgi:hypothetical protein
MTGYWMILPGLRQLERDMTTDIYVTLAASLHGLPVNTGVERNTTFLLENPERSQS